jgi:hypothetical protein
MYNLIQIHESNMTDPTGAMFVEDIINAMLNKDQTEKQSHVESDVIESAAAAAHLPNMVDTAVFETDAYKVPEYLSSN